MEKARFVIVQALEQRDEASWPLKLSQGEGTGVVIQACQSGLQSHDSQTGVRGEGHVRELSTQQTCAEKWAAFPKICRKMPDRVSPICSGTGGGGKEPKAVVRIGGFDYS